MYRAYPRSTTPASTADWVYPVRLIILLLKQAVMARLSKSGRSLVAKGIKVTEVIDHEWAKSIYFKDPNGIQLEFCCYTRDLLKEDGELKTRIKASVAQLGLD